MEKLNVDSSSYLSNKTTKVPPHEKAAIVNLFLDFIGSVYAKEYPYAFWLTRVGKCSYGQAVEILKNLETLPLQYNKAGTIINKLKKINSVNSNGKNPKVS